MASPLSKPIRTPRSQLEATARARLRGDPAPALPGRGDTLGRWRALAALGAEDLALAKVLEAHHDAVAILAELAMPAPDTGELLAVWAAEGPQATLAVRDGPDGPRISGRKPWCSGADFVDGALLTAQEGAERVLVKVSMRQPGIVRSTTDWHALGMSAIASGTVEFDAVRCVRIGAPGAYLERPGFWHGGAGIAACWFGAAATIAQRMADSARVARDPHLAASLGRVDMALGASAALLRELAARIDAAPGEPHRREVVRLRSFVERACQQVLDAAGRSLGPGPLCTDADHAQRCADLAVFMRQSHAERDWAALGLDVAGLEAEARWPL